MKKGSPLGFMFLAAGLIGLVVMAIVFAPIFEQFRFVNWVAMTLSAIVTSGAPSAACCEGAAEAEVVSRLTPV